MSRSNKQETTIKGKIWSRGTYSRLPFSANVNLNLSIIFFPLYGNLNERQKKRKAGGKWSRARDKTTRRVTIPMPLLATFAINFLTYE